MAYRLLSILEQSNIREIIKEGITASTYNMVAQYLAPRGFGWAQATGIMKQIIPSFSGIDFASHWYRPYQQERQRRNAAVTGWNTQLDRKNIIEADLKENTRYMYYVEFDTFDDSGSSIGKQTRAFYSNDALTPEDVEFNGERKFNAECAGAYTRLDSFRFVGMFHNKTWDW